MNNKRYRFFVSYSKVDEVVAKVAVRALERLGHSVKEMSRLDSGVDFVEEIRGWIDWSHFVLPVITEKSKTRAWVHQEIGYALGRHVPLVPIVFQCRPDSLAFLDKVQALYVINKADLKAGLLRKKWGGLLNEFKDLNPFPVSACDSDAKFRSTLLAAAARKIHRNFPKIHICIRQSSRLTSFSLPQNHSSRPWRSVGNIRGSLFWLQTEERAAFQPIADRGTCDLRIDPDYFEYSDGRRRLFLPSTPDTKPGRDGYDPAVQRARLKTLQDFLRSRDDKNVRVIVDDEFAFSDSVTIIGDHWLAFSAAVAPYEQSRKTIWTWHAPTIGWECEKFDEEFNADLLAQQSQIKPRSSRTYAIERIERAIKEITREFEL